MAIFETLYLLFKGENSDILKKTDEVINSNKKLNNQFKKTTESSFNFEQSISSLAKNLSVYAASFLSVNAILSEFKTAIDYDLELGRTSRELRVNVSELDAWGNAVKSAGGTVEGFQSSLRSIAQHFNTTPQVALKVLPQLANLFSRLGTYASLNYSKAIGIDPGTLLLLQKGSKQVQELLAKQKELGLVTENDVKVTTDYNTSLTNLEHSFRSLFNAIIIPSVPGQTNYFDKLTEGIKFLIKHKDVVVGVLIAIGVAGAAAMAPFIAGLLLANADLIIGIGLFALFYDELESFKKGGKTVIIPELLKISKILDGWIEKILNFLDKFEIFKNYVKEIRDREDDINNSSDPLVRSHMIPYYKIHQTGSALDHISTNSILNSTAFNRNVSLNTGPITIQTSATDAEGIALHFGRHLNDHLSQANYNFADNKNA